MLNNFRFLTSGESHGKCLTGIIDGLPAGFEINIELINKDLKRRQGGYGRGDRMKIETDEVEVKSGVRFGKTTGAPVCLEVQNRDWANWQSIMNAQGAETDEKSFTKPRPGHADFAGSIKYNANDLRDILERSSARKTAMDVAIGSVAKQILAQFDIEFSSEIVSIGGENSEDKIKEKIEFAKTQGDTLGGKFEVKVKKLPIGLGSHVQWDRKLDGLLSQAVMSIPAVKAVEFGLGAKCADAFGSEVHDEIFVKDGKYYRQTNNAGGLEGSMTNGEDLIISAVMKPIPTMRKPLATVDLKDKTQTEAHFERSDVCAVSSCAVVAEAMIACVLVDAFLDKFGKDNFFEIKQCYEHRIK